MLVHFVAIAPLALAKNPSHVFSRIPITRSTSGKSSVLMVYTSGKVLEGAQEGF